MDTPILCAEFRAALFYALAKLNKLGRPLSKMQTVLDVEGFLLRLEVSPKDEPVRQELLARVTEPIPVAADLDETDRIVLSVLAPSWQPARTIARKAGFSPNTAKVRVSLGKLVRSGVAENERGRGYRLKS